MVLQPAAYPNSGRMPPATFLPGRSAAAVQLLRLALLLKAHLYRLSMVLPGGKGYA